MFAQHSIDISARQARFSNLRERVALTRASTEKLTEPLSDEDQTVQAMDDASPAKWHLAHTTWFFEVFVLEPYMKDYEQFDARFHYCFNSYYETAGPRHPRPKRGLLTRPAASEVRAYRRHVTGSLDRLLSNSADYPASLAELIELGINHEQQHQELIQTDILSLFAENPLRPALHAIKTDAHWKDNSKGGLAGSSKSRKWPVFKGGIRTIGHDGEGFSYDNESPRHDVLLRPYRMAPGLVTNADWLAFMDDGGYKTPTLWLADGWTTAVANGWDAPGYWENQSDGWVRMTLEGIRPIELEQPVNHVSYYEADAYARWSGHRLPTEFEWEAAVMSNEAEALADLYGAVWQWTQSAYAAYPGYKPAAGAVGEYNGKFMCNQFVLRGSSHATADGHSRATYRNFFPPAARWQFTGLRLAEDIT